MVPKSLEVFHCIGILLLLVMGIHDSDMLAGLRILLVDIYLNGRLTYIYD